MFKRKVLTSLLIALISSCAFAEYKVSTTLSKEEQKNKAQELYKNMAQLDNDALDDLINMHTQVIEKCPESARAQESCWKLSNLFIIKQSDFQSAVEVLEHLIKQYPDSELVPAAKNRLMTCYKSLNEYDKVCKLYEEIFANDPNPSNKTYIVRALAYGKALDAIGKAEEAQKWYQEVINRDKTGMSLEARAARKLLAQ